MQASECSTAAGDGVLSVAPTDENRHVMAQVLKGRKIRPYPISMTAVLKEKIKK